VTDACIAQIQRSSLRAGIIPHQCKGCRDALWAPNGPMLVHHLSAMHPAEVGPYLARMATEDIATVAAEAFEVIEGNETP